MLIVRFSTKFNFSRIFCDFISNIGEYCFFFPQVSVHYIGKLKKNGKIFDSNIGRAPFKFRLGTVESNTNSWYIVIAFVC